MSREIEQLLDRARAQIGHQNLRGAIELLRQALSIDSDDATAHALLSICLHGERRLHAAEYEAKAALTLAPEDPLAHYAMAVVHQSARRFEDAERHFQQAIALSPYSHLFYLALARLYGTWNRTKEAAPLLEKARELAPDEPDCWAALAEHHWSLAEFQPARAAVLRALELDPQNADALLVMGHLLLREGKVRDAREHALLVLRGNAMHEGAVGLLSAVKARESVVLGLWWRFNSFFGAGPPARRVLMLVGLYILYRVGVMVAGDLGYAGAQLPLVAAWLAFCVYTWTGPVLFQKQLDRELAPAKLSEKY
jgi:tetratricopeptide (TPR) repeat protein